MRKNTFKEMITKQIVFLFIIAFFICFLVEHLYSYKQKFIKIETEDLDTEKIAAFNITGNSIASIKQYCDANNIDFTKYFTSYMIYNDYEVDDVSYDYDQDYYHDNKDYNTSVEQIYRMILSDIEYFPIPKVEAKEYWYSNSWEADRTYGGDRKHYGTDIMDVKDERSSFPIVSMTDGVIENIGWLELGGWRIGIRTQNNAYFYYAHLDKYAKNLKTGMKVEAGDLLGYMGNSGYGKEDTYGKFQVHLHLGISLPLNNEIKEYWINPYWILRYLENNKVDNY